MFGNLKGDLGGALKGALFGSLPIQGTDVARSWDHLYIFLVLLSVFFFVLVVGGMLFFAWKYRDRPGHKSEFITGHFRLEVIWTVIPTILLLGIFAWGWVVYKKMVSAPGDALTVRVLGKQWLWNFQYDDGRVFTNEVFVPAGKPVRLLMTSEDVLHSFFIPNFRIKQDVVPGMYTQIWFEARVPGRHQVFCAEYCGASHSDMLAHVYALEPHDWEMFKRGRKIDTSRWLSQAPNTASPISISQAKSVQAQEAEPVSLVAQGKKLTQMKGCIACHSDNGTRMTGPSYKGLFGSKVEFSDGTSAVADENYLRASIERPLEKVVKGFPSTMPAYKGLLTESEMGAIVEYIKSVR